MNRSITAGLLVLTLLGLGACNGTDTALNSTPSPSQVATPTDAEPTSETAAQTTSSTPADATPEAAPNATTKATSDATTRAAADYTVIPGQRVGQVTSNTSRQQLAELYGEENLTDAEIPMGEGFTEAGTVVSLGNEAQFAVVWLDASRSRPLMAKDFSADWKTPEGIGLGTSYAELQQQLGEFQLYGFAWEYGGTLSLEGSQLEQYYGNLLLRVEPSDASIEANSEAYQASMGDRLIPSSDPNLAQLDIAVVDMMVYLNDPVE